MSLNQLSQLVCERYSYHAQIASVPLALALIAILALIPIQGVRAEGVQVIEEVVVYIGPASGNFGPVGKIHF